MESSTVSVVITALFALLSAENWSLALQSCLTLIGNGTKDARVFFSAGLCYWRLGQKEEGAAHFELALTLDPDVRYAAYAHSCLGVEARRLSRNADGSINQSLVSAAISHFEKAIELDRKGHAGIYANSLAGCLALRGNLELGVQWYDWAVSHGYHRPNDCLRNKAKCLELLGLHAQAYQMFAELASRDPEDGESRLCMARIKLNAPSALLVANDTPVVEIIESALPSLQAARDAAQIHAEERVVYFVKANQPAVVREENTLAAAVADLSEAHGLAAISCAYSADWGRAESHIRACRSYNPNHPLIDKVLWTCSELADKGGLELYVHLMTEFGPPAAASGRLNLQSSSNSDSGFMDGQTTAKITLGDGVLSSSDFFPSEYGLSGSDTQPTAKITLGNGEPSSSDFFPTDSDCGLSDSDIQPVTTVFAGEDGGLPVDEVTAVSLSDSTIPAATPVKTSSAPASKHDVSHCLDEAPSSSVLEMGSPV